MFSCPFPGPACLLLQHPFCHVVPQGSVDTTSVPRGARALGALSGWGQSQQLSETKGLLAFPFLFVPAFLVLHLFASPT